VAPATYRFGLGPALGWPETEKRIREARSYWLATANPNGAPHVTPVWAVWAGTALWFDGLPTTRWARNLARRPQAVFNLESAEHAVIVEGVVDEPTPSAELGDEIQNAWRKKYGPAIVPNLAVDGIFRLTPHKVKAWSESLEDGACFELTPGVTTTAGESPAQSDN
jgi:hypothetical protein